MKASITYLDKFGAVLRADEVNLLNQNNPADVLEHLVEAVRWKTEVAPNNWQTVDIRFSKDD